MSYPFAPVSANAVGGAEQVLSLIDRALVTSGHRSIVIAIDGSNTAGELITIPSFDPARCLNGHIISEHHSKVRDTISNVLSRREVDVVHMHGIDFYEYLPSPPQTVLATLHLPLAWYPSSALKTRRPATWLNCVSANQSRGSPPGSAMLEPIENGVPVEDLGAIQVSKRDYTLMLARVCREKGQHLALHAAHAVDVTLLIAGSVFNYQDHQEYFRLEVEPLLDRKRRYIGAVDFHRKRRLLAGAACLLIPSVAPETSSLAAMEAASCGTPVVAMRSGALPDVVEHGRSGFIVDDVAAMAAAIRRVGEIDPETCRAIARKRFTATRMTDSYIETYRKLAGQ